MNLDDYNCVLCYQGTEEIAYPLSIRSAMLGADKPDGLSR